MDQNEWDRQIFCFLQVLLLCLCLTATGLAATPDRPDAGTTMEGLKERNLLTPERAEPNVVVVPPQQKPSVSNGLKIKLQGIRISGQEIFKEAQLQPLVEDAIGKELTLGDLEILAGRISQYFIKAGYLVAKAYIPAQDIQDGIVEINVLVGQYGKIDIRNHSGLTQNAAAALLKPIKSGDTIKSDILERTLLLLNDTSGVMAKTTLRPGRSTGTSDLVIELSDTAKISGQVYADNYGNSFTGQTRGGINTNLNNLNGRGDLLNFGYIYTGSGLSNYNLNYLLPMDSQGLKIGVGYSRMNYTLGEGFADLNAYGVAKIGSIYGLYALKRSRNFNLNVRIGYDSKQLEDIVESAGTVNRRKAGVWNMGVGGNNRDRLGGGGITSFALTYFLGQLSMESDDALAWNSTTQTAGIYSKTNLSIYRLQTINSRLDLHLSFTGQFASKNLDSSEKLSLGGTNGVRAYPQGEAPGDEGYIFTGEFRWNLPTPRFQLAAFFDQGSVTLNKKPWDPFSLNSRLLAGAGLGLIWSKPGDYSFRCDYAWKLTSDPATSDKDKNGRLWIQAVKYF